MRIAAILLLLFGLMAHTLKFSGTLVQFGLNQKEIAKTLCVKKEVPNNTCQGKCHLVKMMKVADQEGENKPASPERTVVVMPLHVPSKTECQFYSAPKAVNRAYVVQPLPWVLPFGIKHPPRG